MQNLAPAPPVMDMNDDEPPNKKNRQEDNLIPEDVFMQCHKVSSIASDEGNSFHLVLPLPESGDHSGSSAQRERQARMEAERPAAVDQHRPRRLHSEAQAEGPRRDRYAAGQAEDLARRRFLQGQQFRCVLQFVVGSDCASSDQGARWSQEIKTLVS